MLLFHEDHSVAWGGTKLLPWMLSGKGGKMSWVFCGNLSMLKDNGNGLNEIFCSIKGQY